MRHAEEIKVDASPGIELHSPVRDRCKFSFREMSIRVDRPQRFLI